MGCLAKGHTLRVKAALCVLLQSFLVKSEAAFKQHPVWANVPPAHQAQAVEVCIHDSPCATLHPHKAGMAC